MWTSIWPSQEDASTCTSKVVIAGNSFVGKSSLLSKFIDGTFDHNFISTVDVDTRKHTFELPKEKKEDCDKIEVDFFDTAGEERFVSFTTSYYREADGVILVYDVTSLESFTCIANWINDIRKHCGENTVKLLVGNKCDLLERRVTEEMGRKLADKINAKFIETSAKKNINVGDAFKIMAVDLLEAAIEKKRIENKKDSQVVIISGENKEETSPTWWCW